MKKMLSLLAICALTVNANAQDRFELGIGAGKTTPTQGEAFKNAASQGDAQNYWLGYGFDENWGVELGLDNLDFDTVNSKHKLINLAAVYRFVPKSWVHPIAKLGVGSIESKDAADVKTTSTGAKLAAGVEADFKYVSVGALLNYYYAQKTSETPEYKDTQAVVPAVFLTLHNALTEEVKSEPVAPVATAAPAPKDTDKDGIVDGDDKCPSTPAGVAVNAIGCSLTEKASEKLNVTFATGKTTLTKDSQAAVDGLAAFMKKFPQTKVEVAGHTDNVGSAKTNTALSQKRAEAVKAALVKAGVEESRLTAKGYGSSQPIADNKTKAGRQENRRVNAEISVETEVKK